MAYSGHFEQPKGQGVPTWLGQTSSDSYKSL